MSLFDFFHSFFDNGPGGKGRPPEFGGDENLDFNKMPNSQGRPSFENDDMRLFSSMFDFMTMTDPFEMQQFFEKKVNEMMKSFMSAEGFPAIQGFGVFDSPDVPAIGAGHDNRDPRDHYLKPGAKLPSQREESGSEKSGPPISQLDKFTPGGGQPGNHIFSSFKSIIRKSVTLPDGTVKTEQIIRNSDGSEERTESLSESDQVIPVPPHSPFGGLDFSGLYKLKPSKIPELEDPRNQFLKPGYEKLNPNSEKIDRDLDKQIEQSGIESLPAFTKEPDVNRSFRSFTRRIVTLPNGVIESEEVVRNSDGTEQRIVSHTWPDGTTKSVTMPNSPTLFTGKNNNQSVEGYDKPVLSFALQGVRDFINILFK